LPRRLNCRHAAEVDALRHLLLLLLLLAECQQAVPHTLVLHLLQMKGVKRAPAMLPPSSLLGDSHTYTKPLSRHSHPPPRVLPGPPAQLQACHRSGRSLAHHPAAAAAVVGGEAVSTAASSGT
jgi:hypothetical protein